MNEMKLFENEQFGGIRVLERDGEPWFVGKDVAEALGYGEGKSIANAVANHVDGEDKGVTELMTPGGRQQVEIIAEREVLGKEMRIYGTLETPLFLAKDVAEWIEHSDVSMLLRSVDEGEKLIQTMFVSGQNREMWFLTEDGLYEVFMQSRKPVAKEFKKKVKEILKSIRKHGMYATPGKIEDLLNDPDAWIQTLQTLKSEREQRKALEITVSTNRPKVLFADSVATSETSILVGDFAKILRQNGVEMGQKRLFEWFRTNGWLMRQECESKNMPTQRGMERGFFEIKETAITLPNGHITVTKTPKITGSGQVFFLNVFMAGAEV